MTYPKKQPPSSATDRRLRQSVHFIGCYRRVKKSGRNVEANMFHQAVLPAGHLNLIGVKLAAILHVKRELVLGKIDAVALAVVFKGADGFDLDAVKGSDVGEDP